MSDNVVKFEPQLVGESYKFDPDEILDNAKGQKLAKVAILGETEDGELWVTGNANAGEIMVLMEKAKRLIVFGEDQPSP